MGSERGSERGKEEGRGTSKSINLIYMRTRINTNNNTEMVQKQTSKIDVRSYPSK